jgi:RHS repeat-associated protein
VPSQSFGYQTNGMLQGRTTGSSQEIYTYDDTNRMVKYHRHPNVIDADFAYGDEGNLTGIDMINSAMSPDWPLADETIDFNSGAGGTKYHLKGLTIGASPRHGFAYEGGDFQTSKGRQTSELEGTVAKRTYVWNNFDLPTSIVDASPSRTVTFVYDAFGNRVRKTSNAGDDVAYLDQLYEQRNLPTFSTRESVYRLVADGGVVAELAHPWNAATRTTTFLFKDHQGSIAFQTAGATSTQRGFFPFGRRMGAAPAQTFSSIGYTGHRQDDDLGLIDMKGRIYSVAQHRFLSKDPIMSMPFNAGGVNPFGYVLNNPVNLTDPSGYETTGPTRDISPPLIVNATPPSDPVSQAMNDPVSGVGASMAQGQSQSIGPGGGADQSVAIGAQVSAQMNDYRNGVAAAMWTGRHSEDGPIPNGGTPAAAQSRIDETVKDLGLKFVQAPTFSPYFYGANGNTSVDGVAVGPNALVSQAQLATTLIHEYVHVLQWAQGRLTNEGVGRTANELEARLFQLTPENVVKANMPPAMQAALAKDVADKISALEQFGGNRYIMEALVLGRVQPPANLVRTDASIWMREADALRPADLFPNR